MRGAIPGILRRKAAFAEEDNDNFGRQAGSSKEVPLVLEVLRKWMQNRARVAVAYEGQGDWYGVLLAVDEMGIVLETTQGEVCLPWRVVRQIRPVTGAD